MSIKSPPQTCHCGPPDILFIKFGIDSIREACLRTLALLCFSAPIAAIHLHYIQPLAPVNDYPWVLIMELSFVLGHLYGLGCTTRMEPYFVMINASIALWAMMIVNREAGRETNVPWCILMPPVVSFTTMSSLLFLVHGTLGLWFLPLTDWEVIRVDDIWTRLEDRLSEPGVLWLKPAITSWRDAFWRAVALLCFSVLIVMIHLHYIQPLAPVNDYPWVLIMELCFVLGHLYGLGCTTRMEPYFVMINASIALWAVMIANRDSGREKDVLWCILMPPAVSIITMSSMLFLVYGTLGTWLLMVTDWEVVYEPQLDRVLSDLFCERRCSIQMREPHYGHLKSKYD
ncbi:hypothetical protein PM082_017010 [Marasmius tenuissimus]|nr:hypothetical protein PM082_017010 [Marasmius tenuissimus]